MLKTDREELPVRLSASPLPMEFSGCLWVIITDITQDDLLTFIIEAISARFDQETHRTLARAEDTTFEFDAGGENASDGVGELGAIGKENRQMIKAGGAGRRRRTAEALPGVEADVMMIAAGGKERRL